MADDATNRAGGAPSFWMGVSDGLSDLAASRGALDDILAIPRPRWSDWERGYVHAATERGLVPASRPGAHREWSARGAWVPVLGWKRFDAPSTSSRGDRSFGAEHTVPKSIRALLVASRRDP